MSHVEWCHLFPKTADTPGRCSNNNKSEVFRGRGQDGAARSRGDAAPHTPLPCSQGARGELAGAWRPVKTRALRRHGPSPRPPHRRCRVGGGAAAGRGRRRCPGTPVPPLLAAALPAIVPSRPVGRLSRRTLRAGPRGRSAPIVTLPPSVSWPLGWWVERASASGGSPAVLCPPSPHGASSTGHGCPAPPGFPSDSGSAAPHPVCTCRAVFVLTPLLLACVRERTPGCRPSPPQPRRPAAQPCGARPLIRSRCAGSWHPPGARSFSLTLCSPASHFLSSAVASAGTPRMTSDGAVSLSLASAGRLRARTSAVPAVGSADASPYGRVPSSPGC